MSTCYRGVNGQLLDAFLIPSLARAKEYRRAVGFFSSSVFQIAGRSFLELFARGGRVELVCSHHFQSRDIAALLEAMEFPTRVPRIPDISLRGGPTASTGRRLFQSAFLSGQLAIKVARPKMRAGEAIYHEKLGMIREHEGATLCFEGSANESRGAYVSNYERIVAHPYRSDAAQAIAEQLRRVWYDTTPGLEVRTFLDALRLNWLVSDDHVDRDGTELKVPDERGLVSAVQIRQETLLLPADVTLRDYQNHAVEKWFLAGGKGIFEMATGSGKTITALALATRLFRQCGGPLLVVVVAPLLHLVDQWNSVARGFGLNPIRCAGNSRAWVGAASDAVYACNTGQVQVASLSVSLATFSAPEFQRLLGSVNSRTLLIVDEVHNAGSREVAKSLPRRVSLRLGLSATPDRFGDEAGTRRLHDYFGDVQFRFGIAEALKAVPPVLTPYIYEPILVHLDSDEVESYLELTQAIVRLVGASDDTGEWPLAAMHLLFRRARLVAGCRQKLPALRAAIAPFAGDNYSLVYCGDSSVGMPEEDDSDAGVDRSDVVVRQIDAVTRLLGVDLKMHVAKYTAETPAAERRLLESRFVAGVLQALVAIRCLDEGVDLPPTRRAFILASSTNPRQFIQRRGRVLRRADGKERAEIYDFIVLPPLSGVDRNAVTSIRGLFKKEIARVVEFAGTATNRYQSLDRLRPALEQFGLQRLLIGEGASNG